MSLNANNTFYKTFTGVDTLAFAIFPKTKPILLGSLTTISYSMYREKKPVPLLGKINTGGYTRGMRSIAGTMIFTLINQHFIRDLVSQIPYLKEHEKIKSDELPFFDILIIAANEYGSNSKMMIYGIDLFEEGQVLSIQDMYIENTLSFVARDIDEFGFSNPIISGGKRNDTRIEKIEVNEPRNKNIFDNMFEIDDINKLQKTIFKDYVSGVYDSKTFEKVRRLQKKYGLRESGYLDAVTYDVLLNKKKALKVISKKRVSIKDEYENEVLGIAGYGDIFIYTEEENGICINFYGKNGYIDKEFVSFLDKNATQHGISIVKHHVDEINSETTKLYLENENCIYEVNTLTKYSDTVSYDNFSTSNNVISLYDESSNSFLYDALSESYPEIVEAFVYKENVLISKYIFDLGGARWE